MALKTYLHILKDLTCNSFSVGEPAEWCLAACDANTPVWFMSPLKMLMLLLWHHSYRLLLLLMMMILIHLLRRLCDSWFPYLSLPSHYSSELNSR